MYNFRHSLREYKTQDELFGFFEKHAQFVSDGVYYCSGLYADDTGKLFQMLIGEWKKEKKDIIKRKLKNKVPSY